MLLFLSARFASFAAGCGRCAANLLQDEQGNWSTSRCAFWAALCYTFALITVVVLGERHPDNAVWALLTAVDTGLLACIGGPRIAQYLLPQLGAITQSVSTAARDTRPLGAQKAYDADPPARGT